MNGRIGNAGLLNRLAFDFKKHHTTAVTGGGGKTHLIFRLAWELTCAGYTVCVTTTTHMKKEYGYPFVEGGAPDEIRRLIQQYGFCVTGCTEPEKDGIVKIAALSEVRRRKLKALCDFVLIEADGSRGLPIKAPKEGEPVIPEETDLVIGVIGLDAVGKMIGETAHRPSLLASLLSKTETDVLTEADLIALAGSKQGLQKNASSKDYRVFLNKDDLPGANESGERICRHLGQKGIQAMHGSLAKKSGQLILLAAGNSRRFGSNKLLYEIEGKPMYRHVLEKLLRIAAYPGLLPVRLSVTVVTQYEDIAGVSEEMGAEVCINPHPEEGIASSLKTGLRKHKDRDFVLFSVADQPWIREDTIRGLLTEWMRSALPLGALSHGEKSGNPCIFSKAFFESLLELEGDRGGKRILMQHPEELFLYPAADRSEMTDLDTAPGGDKHVYEVEKR